MLVGSVTLCVQGNKGNHRKRRALSQCMEALRVLFCRITVERKILLFFDRALHLAVNILPSESL